MIARSVTTSTKGIILVHPHNPTGMFLRNYEYRKITEIAVKHGMAVISDEVFLDYPLGDTMDTMGTTAGTSDVLTFTLSGISKTLGLPQLKLGWIVISGPESLSAEAAGRLEILSDTYLSVNTPVQTALPEIMADCRIVRQGIHERIKSNYIFIRGLLSGSTADTNYPCSVLEAEGGWYAIIRTPRTQTAEAWAMELLSGCNLYVYPGHFFDFEDDGFLVASLLTEEETFRSSVRQIADFISESVRK